VVSAVKCQFNENIYVFFSITGSVSVKVLLFTLQRILSSIYYHSILNCMILCGFKVANVFCNQVRPTIPCTTAGCVAI